MSEQKLGAFLTECLNWDWERFARAERDKGFTSNQAVIFSLVRACAQQKIEAIKLAVNRLDGKLKTPVKVEYPKIFYVFPYATLPPGPVTPSLESPETDAVTGVEVPGTNEPPVLIGEVLVPTEPEFTPEITIEEMGLRQTLAKMSDYPRETPERLVKMATQTEHWIRGNAERPPEIPRVKSVVAANLLLMAQNRNIDALYQVFDDLEGKLVETIQLVGDDLYITSYATTAPPDAYRNEDGILQIEAEQAQQVWNKKLEQQK